MATRVLTDQDFLDAPPVLTDRDFTDTEPVLTDADFTDSTPVLTDADMADSTPDLEGQRQTEQTVTQLQQAIPAIQQAAKDQAANDPKTWTSQQTKQQMKENPPQTIPEQAQANAMVKSKQQQENELTDRLLGGPDAQLKAAKQKTVMDKLWAHLDESPERLTARAQNIYGISKATGLPLQDVAKEYETLRKDPSVTGMRSGLSPTGEQAMQMLAFAPGVGVGLAVAPVATMTGLGTFMATDAVFSWAGRQLERVPQIRIAYEQLSEGTKNTLGVTKLLVEGMAAGGVASKAPRVAQFLTKQVLDTYQLPKSVYFSPEKVRAMFVGPEGTVIPGEQEVWKAAGVTGPEVRQALKNGVSIQVPAERLATMADRPWWAQLKELIGVKPSPPLTSTSLAGRPHPAAGALPAPAGTPATTESPTPPALSERILAIAPTPVMNQDEARVMLKHRVASFPDYQHEIVKTPTGYEVLSYTPAIAPSRPVVAPTPDATPTPPLAPETPKLPLQTPLEPALPEPLPPGVASVPPPAVPPTPVSETVTRLSAAIESAKPIRTEQEAIYTKARAERVARLMAVRGKTKGLEGYYSELGQLKGGLPKASYESVADQFTADDVTTLMDAINGSALTPFETITAKGGLVKILGIDTGGSVPTRGEIDLLDEVFGPQLTKAIMSQRPLKAKVWSSLGEAANLPRSLMASFFDLSMTFRQGVVLIGTKAWRTAVAKQLPLFASERVFQDLQASIRARPTYPQMRQAGLALTRPDSPNLAAREERYMASGIAEKIPIIGRGVRATNRAYSGALNLLRADTFDRMLADATAEKMALTDKHLHDIATFVNAATGRGSLGAMEAAAVPMNAFFFSPRLMASRLNLLYPGTYVGLDPSVRKEAVKSMFRFAAIGLTILGLAKLAGAKVESDPRNADFGKLKVGNTRYDLWGGFQQPIVGVSRFVTGRMISSTTGRETVLGEGYKPTTRKDILLRYFESKEAPIFSLITTLLEGQAWSGQPANIPAEVLDRFIPMAVSDIYDAAMEWGPQGGPMALPTLGGVGVQTYGETIPYEATTDTGRTTTRFRPRPGLAETLVNMVSGTPTSTIPDDLWPLLKAKHDAEIQVKIEQEKIRKELFK